MCDLDVYQLRLVVNRGEYRNWRSLKRDDNLRGFALGSQNTKGQTVMLGRIVKWTAPVAVAILIAVSCTSPDVTAVPAPAADTLRVGTYNVHYIILGKQTGAWSVGDWEERKTPMDQAFKALDPDLMAFQEMESFAGHQGPDINLTLDWLLAQNPDFAAASVGDPKITPWTQPILYRKSRLTLVDQGWFFFSDTPDVIYSRTFNGSFPAFASLATFIDKPSGEKVTVVNVHFEYKSRSNRLKSAALVVERIAPLIAAGEKVILLGDINARPGARTQNILAGAGLDFLPIEGSTYHFNRGLNLFGAIDHIALSDGMRAVGAPYVLRQKFDGVWPSDHYPVIADIAFD